ncbi:MAG: histidine ammonia-lyase [Planctomycetota bacterium]
MTASDAQVFLGKIDSPVTLDQWVTLAQGGGDVGLSSSTPAALHDSRQVVEDAIADGRVVYGVNTGFGKLANVQVGEEELGTLQRNLLLSHATGVGKPFDDQVVRLALLLRVHSIAKGCSGVRLELVEALLNLYRNDLVPVVPEQGSVGASGDLAPLAHLVLPVIGEGYVRRSGEVVHSAQALTDAGLEPIVLKAKEGLALINGTQIMTAVGLLTLHRAQRVSRAADICCASTLEALQGSERPYMPAVHEVRAHPGQRDTAINLRSLLKDSKIIPGHANCSKVQDAYSLRCAPQVHGAAKEALRFAESVLLREAESVTDNPLVFPDGEVVSAGNFHGQPISQAMDILKIGISTLANISERRVENLVNPDISGLPPFLAHNPGVESGLMIPQVVAAALASENKTLAHPASVDTVPTSANREDHVSMGVTAARHARQVVDNSARVLGIELISAMAGLDCGEGLEPGRGVRAAYGAVRARVEPLDSDRFLAPDLEAAFQLLVDGSLEDAVLSVTGPLL